MILRALYDYYNRCDNLPKFGMEEKQIGFLIVISKDGKFLRFEDCRIGKQQARTYLVKKHVGRASNVAANYLYDNSAYVLGISNKNNGKEQLYFDTFKKKVEEICEKFPKDEDLQALSAFYKQGREKIASEVMNDPLRDDIQKNLNKKYSTFSFRIDGDTKIIAEKREIVQLESGDDNSGQQSVCLVTGNRCTPVRLTTATMIPGSQAIARLVAFQVKSGYDSYGKEQCYNAPISEDAEFAYTTALNAMLASNSRNKFLIGNRTFVFWASSQTEAAEQAEAGLFELLGFQANASNDNPNAKIAQVRKVFTAIYSGKLTTSLDDRFYILGLAPNSARIAVVYWSESQLRDFAAKILQHFNDMEIVDTRKEKKPYMGIKDMLSAVTLGGKQTEATPNLPEALTRSIFQGIPYPYTLFSACIRRIRAESGDKDKKPIRIGRIAIIKAYLNRLNDNNKKIEIMLDKTNTNPGYLCGRLFAVLDKIQEDANGISSIRERYMNAASATPSAVFATILNLSLHHWEKLPQESRKVFYEKLKQEIIDKFPADGFPAHLDLQDQGRFFVGYYHQRQDFFTKKEDKKEEDNN